MTDEHDSGRTARAATTDEGSTGDTGTDEETATRGATVTTTHGDAAAAERVAAALDPDNTAEMATRTDGDRVVTTVRRNSTGSLRSTVDDYVVNATVADRLTTDDAGDGQSDTDDTDDIDDTDTSDTTPA